MPPKCSRDPYRKQWWPWDQQSRNQLLAFLLWLTSKYRWHLQTYMRAVSLLDRAAMHALRPTHVPTLEYHRFLLALAAMSLAYKFEEGCPTECRWVPQQAGYAEVAAGSLWKHLVPDFNACLQASPPLTACQASNAEAALMNALDWDLHYDTPLHAALRVVDTRHHRQLFSLHLLLRTLTFLTVPQLDTLGLVQQLLAGQTAHPDLGHLRAWLALPLPHPVLRMERHYLRLHFPCLFASQ